MANNNLDGLNLATRTGEGGADVMQWGGVDKAINQINQERQKREAQGYSEYIANQQSLDKELANTRSDDLPEIIQSKEKYKQAKQQLLFDKALRRDPLLYNQKQREAANLYAETLQKIKVSQEGKQTLKADNERIYTHPELHSDEAANIIANAAKVPTSQWNKIGYTADKLLYHGNDYDPTKALEAAKGDTKNVPVDMGYVDDKKLEKLENTYKVNGTSGGEFYNRLVQSMTVRDPKNPNVSPVKFWSNKWTTTPKEKIAEVDQQYQALPAKTLQKFGLKKDPLEYKENMSNAEKAAVFVAQQHVLNNIPDAPISTKRIADRANIMDANDEEYDRRYGRAEGDRLRRLKLGFAHTDANLAGGQLGVDEYLNDAESGKVDASNGFRIMNFKPSTTTEFKKDVVVPVDVINAKLKEKGQPFKSKKVTITPTILKNPTTGDYWAVYPKVNEKTGEVSKTYDWNNGEHKIPESQVKSTIIKTELPSSYKTKALFGVPKSNKITIPGFNH